MKDKSQMTVQEWKDNVNRRFEIIKVCSNIANIFVGVINGSAVDFLPNAHTKRRIRDAAKLIESLNDMYEPEMEEENE